MADGRIHAHTLATVALCLVSIAAIVGGCTLSVPEVTNTRPNQADDDVPVHPPVVHITFDQPMMTQTIQDSFSITPPVGDDPPVFTWYGDLTVAITFNQDFAPETRYTIEIGSSAKATNGVSLANPFILVFTTAPAPPVGTGPSNEDYPPLSFTSSIFPIAKIRCSGCHQGAMIDYDNIISKGWVIPEQPDRSVYYTKPAGLAEHPGGDVWKEQSDMVRRWILQGAPY